MRYSAPATPEPRERVSANRRSTHFGPETLTVQRRLPFWYYHRQRSASAKGKSGPPTAPVPPNFSRKFSRRTLHGYRGADPQSHSHSHSHSHSQPGTHSSSLGKAETQLVLCRANARRKRSHRRAAIPRVEASHLPVLLRRPRDPTLLLRKYLTTEPSQQTTHAILRSELRLLVPRRLAGWKPLSFAHRCIPRSLRIDTARSAGTPTIKAGQATDGSDAGAVTATTQLPIEAVPHDCGQGKSAGPGDVDSPPTTDDRAHEHAHAHAHANANATTVSSTREPWKGAAAIIYRRMYIFSQVIANYIKPQSK
ncbi:hypothetical protein GGR50DRAFT_671727 [Xylaria sp. CBS 124048]|nr:hypothetical protein GGR50DRAFT_671727 [Xylaria sp. CBS 124048]